MVVIEIDLVLLNFYLKFLNIMSMNQHINYIVIIYFLEDVKP
jgi:hypothetical protein